VSLKVLIFEFAEKNTGETEKHNALKDRGGVVFILSINTYTDKKTLLKDCLHNLLLVHSNNDHKGAYLKRSKGKA